MWNCARTSDIIAWVKTAKDLRIPYTWSERYPVFLEKFFYIPGHYHRHEGNIPWSDPRIFGNDLPVAIEYCSGNGQWIGERARENPNKNWIAVEKCFERARKIWLKLHREQIPNLYVVCGEALTFTKYYPTAQSVSEIYVNFPDPWPKRRHALNRLVRAPFLQELERIVPFNGKATFATDDFDYASFMLKEIALTPNWKPRIPYPFYSTDWEGYGQSFFSDLWKQKGRTIYYLPFENCP